MASRLRTRRVQAPEPLGSARRAPVSPGPAWGLADRADAAGGLDLAGRIALTTDLQQSAGNAAVAQLVGLLRTDRRREPPDGAREIMDAGGGGTRGLTRTRYVANPPIFRIGRVEQADGAWTAKPVDVNLPSLDHTVSWPAAGRHRLRPYGEGSQILEVSEEWSSRILQGEDEHVGDIDRAWDMTWGRVAAVINAMAAGAPCRGATADEARAAAWRTFRGRLPAPLRPESDTPDAAAQEAKWGADAPGTIFSRLMAESQRARDHSGWHTPDQNLKEMEGSDRIDELSVGRSRIGEVPPDQLMQEAWNRVTRG